ncbi:MAG: hypothetical protein IPM92_14220 [Saprospiraceae bacterium]|nr:hypothetical protein [Saprospiraceae bacterium]
MDTKLTLTMNKQVIRKAKKYVKTSGRSLSDLVENYLKNLTSSDLTEFEISPKVKSLMGSIKVPEDFDAETVLTEELIRKYKK